MGVDVTDLIFAEKEEADQDLFPIKANNVSVPVLVGVFLEIALNILPNCCLKSLAPFFVGKTAPGGDGGLGKDVGWKEVAEREDTAFHFKIVRHIWAT